LCLTKNQVLDHHTLQDHTPAPDAHSDLVYKALCATDQLQCSQGLSGGQKPGTEDRRLPNNQNIILGTDDAFCGQLAEPGDHGGRRQDIARRLHWSQVSETGSSTSRASRATKGRGRLVVTGFFGEVTIPAGLQARPRDEARSAQAENRR